MITEKFNIVVDYKALGIEQNGFQPTLQSYIPDKSEEYKLPSLHPAVIVCPGGAYKFLSDREGDPIALKFIAGGICAFVLRYSCAPSKFPAPLFELFKAIAFVRENAEKWQIDPNKIGVVGFSAGAHLGISAGVHWNNPLISESLGIENEKCKPNGLILGYPAITSKNLEYSNLNENMLGENYKESKWFPWLDLTSFVSPETPRCFIWHTFPDKIVPIACSTTFVTALNENKIPFELHIYPCGDHGLSLGNAELCNGWGQEHARDVIKGWADMAIRWVHEDMTNEDLYR